MMDGESLAMTTLAASLVEAGATVSLLGMNPSRQKKIFDQRDFKDSPFEQVDIVPVDNGIYVKDAFSNLFSSDSYHIARFVSKAYEKKLIEVLQASDVDIIQLETIYLAAYIPVIRKYSNAKIVLRSHNVEYEIWERIALNTKNPIKRWYVSLLQRRLKRFEQDCFKQYDSVLFISPKDAEFYNAAGFQGDSITIPIGINAENYHPDYSSFDSNPLSISFIGSLDWMPNTEGLDWFLDEIWPVVIREVPKAKLYVAGRNAPEKLLKKKIKGVAILGEVKDAKAFINEHPLMIVPLLSGSGMRVKILEGMALGRCIFTTSIGLEGIHARHGEEVLVADSPTDFASLLVGKLLQSKGNIQVGCNAERFISDEFDSNAIGRKLLEYYQEII